MSRFATVKCEDARLDSLADPSTLGDLDENDPASVARFMKNMGDEFGDDLGDDFDVGHGRGHGRAARRSRRRGERIVDTGDGSATPSDQTLGPVKIQTLAGLEALGARPLERAARRARACARCS